MQTSQTGSAISNPSTGWLTPGSGRVLALLLTSVLLAFITKPFHMDDPLFLQAARHIQAHPGNPYQFLINWYGFLQPMWDVTKNPPLACYYTAAAASLLGWSEPALHVAFLLPALATLIGTERLAHHFCHRPRLVIWATFFTPVFLVSSTTVMCDVLMLAFWVWATVFWIEGTRRNSSWRIAVAALLIGLAALSKYFGAALLLLLAVWSLIGKHPLKLWLGWLVLPLAILAVYQWWTQTLYGQGLLTEAGNYVVAFRTSSSRLAALLTALSFTGGCLAAGVFFAPLLWSRRQLALGAILTIPMALLVFIGASMGSKFASSPATAPWFVAVQTVFWACGGVSVLALATADVWRRRDPDSSFLGLWVWGTFFFTAFLNWTVSARTLLPMTVPVAILIARRLEQRPMAGCGRFAVFAPSIASAGLALWVAKADLQLAQTTRESVMRVQARYGGPKSTLWFEGHWGFQYYMETAGARALDLETPEMKPGDYVAVPLYNSNIHPLDKETVELEQKFTVPGPKWLTTMNGDIGAGFYSSIRGPLPFAFGRVPSEEVTVYRAQ